MAMAALLTSAQTLLWHGWGLHGPHQEAMGGHGICLAKARRAPCPQDGLAPTWDLPQPALPTTKTECRTWSSSSSCTTFSTKFSSACSFSSSTDSRMTWEGEQALTTSSLGKALEMSRLHPEALNRT